MVTSVFTNKQRITWTPYDVYLAIDLDMVLNFLKLWYHFFKKVNCGIYIYNNEFRQTRKYVSNN